MLTLTDNARVAIRSLTGFAEEPTEAGVRIATSAGGDPTSAGGDTAAPELALAVVPEPIPGDQVVDEGGARVYLDSAAALLLDQETLDAQIDSAAQEVNFFVT
jgi:iron-sulfur cluster assembly protein